MLNYLGFKYLEGSLLQLMIPRFVQADLSQQILFAKILLNDYFFRNGVESNCCSNYDGLQ